MQIGVYEYSLFECYLFFIFLAVVGLHCGAGFSPAARRGAALWLGGEDLSPRWMRCCPSRRVQASGVGLLGSRAASARVAPGAVGLRNEVRLSARSLCCLDVAPGL